MTGAGPAGFFGTVEWARVLRDAYGFVPCPVVGGAATGPVVLPLMEVRSWLTGRRGVAVPFSDCCEVPGLDESRCAALLDYLRAEGRRRRWRYVELRCGNDLPPALPASERFLLHDLDLTPGGPALFDRLAGSVRTSIRKARRAGLEVDFSTTLASVREFHVLNGLTRRRHGLPPQPWVFFARLHEHVLAGGRGVVVTARQGGRVVAGALFCLHRGTVLFKYGASNRQFQALRGTHLLMWEAVERFARDGFTRLSLGRTSFGNPGLRRFKLGWGARESELRYVRYEFRREQFRAGAGPGPEAGYPFLRYLPPVFLRGMGTILYKHMA